MGGCGEANTGGETTKDWAFVVNEKTNIKTRHEKTIVVNSTKSLMPELLSGLV
jgi:hypothetical protein